MPLNLYPVKFVIVTAKRISLGFEPRTLNQESPILGIHRLRSF